MMRKKKDVKEVRESRSTERDGIQTEEKSFYVEWTGNAWLFQEMLCTEPPILLLVG